MQTEMTCLQQEMEAEIVTLTNEGERWKRMWKEEQVAKEQCMDQLSSWKGREEQWNGREERFLEKVEVLERENRRKVSQLGGVCEEKEAMDRKIIDMEEENRKLKKMVEGFIRMGDKETTVLGGGIGSSSSLTAKELRKKKKKMLQKKMMLGTMGETTTTAAATAISSGSTTKEKKNAASTTTSINIDHSSINNGSLINNDLIPLPPPRKSSSRKSSRSHAPHLSQTPTTTQESSVTNISPVGYEQQEHQHNEQRTAGAATTATSTRRVSQFQVLKEKGSM